MLHEAAFGEATPMGSSQFAEDLSQLKPASLVSYREHQYTANNLVIASNGLKADVLKTYANKYLNDLTSGDSNGNSSNRSYTGGDAKLKGNFNGKTYVALAFPTEKNKAYNVLRVLLHNKLNKLEGGEVSCFNAPYASGGIWGVYVCGSSSGASNKLVECAIKELKAITGNVSAIDLDCAKNQV